MEGERPKTGRKNKATKPPDALIVIDVRMEVGAKAAGGKRQEIFSQPGMGSRPLRANSNGRIGFGAQSH